MLLGTLGAILLGNMSTRKGMLRGGYRDKEGTGILKMNKYSSIGTYDTSNLSDQTKFRVTAIIKIEDYFYSEIQEKKLMSKKHCKYIAASDYIDKTLIVLSVTSGGISIISFPSYIGVPAGMASASFTLIFSLTIGIIKKLSEITRNKKKKHKKIVVLAKNKICGSAEKLGVQKIYDLVDKGKCETENNTKQQMRKYERHGSKLIDGEKFVYTHEDIIVPIIMSWRVSTTEANEFRLN